MPEGGRSYYPPVGRKGPASSPNAAPIPKADTSKVNRKHMVPDPGKRQPLYDHQSNMIKPSRPFVKRGDLGDI